MIRRGLIQKYAHNLLLLNSSFGKSVRSAMNVSEVDIQSPNFATVLEFAALSGSCVTPRGRVYGRYAWHSLWPPKLRWILPTEAMECDMEKLRRSETCLLEGSL